MDKRLQQIVDALGACDIYVKGQWMPLDDKQLKRLASEKFYEDLEEGKRTEHMLCGIIKKKYSKAYVREGYCKGYDIHIPEIDKTVEVKQDKKSNYTGNIVVEVEMPIGKPSALSTTTSDFWAFYDGEYFMWWTPDALKKLVSTLRPVTFVGNGDTIKKKAYLVKKDIIKSQAIRLTELKD